MLSITVNNRKTKYKFSNGVLHERNKGLICFFNENTGEHKVIKQDVLPDNLTEHLKKFGLKNKSFGCYHKDEFVFVANSDRLIKLDRKGNYIDHITLDGFDNPHQIIVTDDVKCFTNTEKDLIELTYKNKNYTIDLKTLDNVVNDLEINSHHVNSLCLNDNKIFFCLHNRGTKPSQYFYIDLKTQQIEYLFEYGKTSHNCEVEGDFLYTLDTRGGNFACINWKTGKGWETKLVDRKDYFLRGLVLTKNHFIIGASLTETNVNKGNSQILFVDRETKEIINRYDIEGYNVVNDIKLSNEIDFGIYYNEI